MWAVSCPLFGQSESLNLYLKMAGENNPAVRAAFHMYEAALQRVPQMGALDDPQLEAGFFLDPMNLVDGRQIGSLRLMQMFPWFGTRKAARTEAGHMAEMAFEQFREIRDNLYLEVYTQWYTLCSLQQQLANSRSNREWLQQLETLALQRYRSATSTSPSKSPQRGTDTAIEVAGNASGMGGMNMGGTTTGGETATSSSGSSKVTMNMDGATAGMTEVLRIRLELEETNNNMEDLASKIVAGKARFNALLNRPAESAVAVPDTLIQLPFDANADSLMQIITRQNPMLGMLHEERLAYEAKTEMARKMGYPMFGIGLEYMLIAKTTEGVTSMNNMEAAPIKTSGMNGKNMVMPMVSVSIPVYRGKHKAAQKESSLMRQAADEKYADALNRLQADLYRYRQQTDDAVRKIALYRKQTAFARTTYTLILQEFASGKGSLADLIQVQRQLLDYRLKEAETVAAYNIAVANIWKIASMTLTDTDKNFF
ncbi:MAG: TolC family protein [Bacteroidales bacterium]|jgi:outer membrane protein TolC|nr:TolC family protein [Bacteroidales bacterium]